MNAGQFHYGGGAGHGGRGYRGPNGVAGGVYGETDAPVTPGSGGAGNNTDGALLGGSGGGAVRIAASGLVTINGTINANGLDTTHTSGGGSGGSIYITCDTFAGNSKGLLTAKGGIGSTVGSRAGDGGGGRIAVVYNPASQVAASKPGVRFNVAAGYAAASYHQLEVGNTNLLPNIAIIGTVYLPDDSLFKSPFDNFNDARIYGPTNWATDSLLVTNVSVRFAESEFRLTVTNTLTIGTGSVFRVGSEFDNLGYFEVDCQDLVVTGGGRLYVHSGPTNGTPGDFGGLISVGNNITVAIDSWISPVSEPLNGGSVLITAARVTLDAGGGIDANGLGYRGGYFTHGYGLGKGTASGTYYAGGGGYGGAGGMGKNSGDIDGGITCGSSNAPVEPGSGGGGSYYGFGGGSVRIQASNAITVNGTIQANGYNNSGADAAANHGGGGSGGGIFLVSPAFSGAASGLLSADGGNGRDWGATIKGGSGGGGRISVVVGLLDTTEINQLIAGEPVSRILCYESHANYLGSTSVAKGTIVSGTPDSIYEGQPGTQVFLHRGPPAGTVITIR